MRNAHTDRRLRRTHQSLVNALVARIQAHGYDAVTVSDVLNDADVGRSTFYTHYRNKDDLLLTSISGPFGILADGFAATIRGDADDPKLESILEHFEENRLLFRCLMTGAAGQLMAARGTVLYGEMIETRLTDYCKVYDCRPTVSLSVIAQCLAAAHLAVLRAWLIDGASGSPATFADLFRRFSGAAVRALLLPHPKGREVP